QRVRNMAKLNHLGHVDNMLACAKHVRRFSYCFLPGCHIRSGKFMATLNENPFAVLTAVVAPAILTNASSVLCLGTANRIARVVDRTRVITKELEGLGSDTAEYRLRVEQLKFLEIR